MNRLMLYLVVAICVAAVGCSSDAPLSVKAKVVSDVGTLVQVHEYDDGAVEEFEYLGFSFFGDILLSEFEEAVDVVLPNYSEFESLLSIENYRVYPQSQLDEELRPGDGFVLTTCTVDSATICDRGHHYIFRETTDGFGLLPVVTWFWLTN